MTDEGYAPTYRSLIEDTEWERYGVGRNPRCDNCMAHCGFEGTAVNDAFSHPLKAFLVSLRGPKVFGPMAPELPVRYAEGTAHPTIAAVPVSEIKHMNRGSDESAGVAATR